MMQVYVTQSDIDLGRAVSCYNCPVARALSRHFEGYEISVNGMKFRVYIKGDVRKQFSQALPYKVRKWIGDFDHYLPVKPFSFHIPSYAELWSIAK